MHFAKLIGVPYLHILGNSSTIINCLKRKIELSALNLEGWCRNIRELESSFLHSDAFHVYIEHNVIADGLSKEALTLALGLLFFSEFSEGVCVFKDSLQLFLLE